MCLLFKATHLSIAIGEHKIIPVSKEAQHVAVQSLLDWHLLSCSCAAYD
jgi:hypothetical protein